MKIAICDDDIHELAYISTIIEQYKTDHCASLTYEVFNSPYSLLNKITDEPFDLLLLDVVMPNMTGIELARSIRAFNTHVPIVFLTSSPEFAVASYRVQASDYLLKPVDEELLYEILENEYNKSEDFLLVKTAQSLMQIPFSQIVYLETVARKLVIYSTSNAPISPTGTLSEYEEQLLKYKQFYKPHRSYLVNLQHVVKLDKEGLHTALGNIVPIPKANFSKTKNDYMNHLMS